MTAPLRASVVVDSYNYADFLQQAVQSALDQTYPHLEVIVVDDGSQDGSREIVESFGDRVIPILKENGGQASSLNAGVAASSGDLLFFLDCDDTFLPHKVERMVEIYEGLRDEHPLSYVFHRVQTVDREGRPGRVFPASLRSLEKRELQGDLARISSPNVALKHARRFRFLPFVGAPTCGISLTRALAERVFPLPEAAPLWADNYVVRASLLLGDVFGVRDILSTQLMHGENPSARLRAENRVFQDSLEAFLNAKLVELGHAPFLSFYDSMYASSYFIDAHSSKDLLRLALQVPRAHLSRRTLTFALESVGKAARLALRGERAYERRLDA